MDKRYCYDSFLYGVSYYPERWPEAEWDGDLARIAQTGTNDQVRLPRFTAAYRNPSLLLDSSRFTSNLTTWFAVMQREIIKRFAPHQSITNNAFQTTNVGMSKFTQESVDFVSYDTYSEFKVCDLTLPSGFRDPSELRHLSKIRWISSKFMVLGQQAWPSNKRQSAIFKEVPFVFLNSRRSDKATTYNVCHVANK